jgi:O-antigen/teichoic acid export membrane protein
MYGYVFAMIASNLIALVYSFMYSGSFKYLTIVSIKKVTCVEMLKYSIPLIPNAVMWWLISMFNRPLIESHLGMHTVGIFAVANKFPGILSLLFTIFAVSWQISVLEEFGKPDYSVFFNKIFRMVVFVLMFLFFIITICSKLLVSLFVSADFYESWQYVPILLLGAVFLSISSFVGSNFSATRESKYFFYSSICGAVSAILFNFLFIPKLGIMGAAISILVSFAMIAVMRIKYCWNYVKIQNPMRYLGMFLLGVVAIIITINMQMLFVKFLLQICIFLLFLLINRDLKGDFLKLYLKFRAKL